MSKFITSNQMKKRSQGEILGALVLLSLVIVGGIGGYKIISENRYVGDKTTMQYYDLKKCDISSIPKENIVNLNDINEAKEYEYVPASCSLS